MMVVVERVERVVLALQMGARDLVEEQGAWQHSAGGPLQRENPLNPPIAASTTDGNSLGRDNAQMCGRLLVCSSPAAALAAGRSPDILPIL